MENAAPRSRSGRQQPATCTRCGATQAPFLDPSLRRHLQRQRHPRPPVSAPVGAKSTRLLLPALSHLLPPPHPPGSLFLLLFLAWGVAATRLSRHPSRVATAASAGASLALWSATAAAGFTALLAQLLLPLLPDAVAAGSSGAGGGAAAAAAAAVGPGSFAWWALGLRDLSKCGVWALIAVSR